MPFRDEGFYKTPDFQEQISAAGCDDFIGKPIRADELFAKIGRLLDLTFVYTPAVETASQTEKMAEPLPESFCHNFAARLREAADLGDVGELASIAEEIRGCPYDSCELASAIEQSVKRFDFDSLMDIAERLDGEQTAAST